MNGRTIKLATLSALLAGTLLSEAALADSRKEYHFNVGLKAGVSVNNPYGSISVKPSTVWRSTQRSEHVII